MERAHIILYCLVAKSHRALVIYRHCHRLTSYLVSSSWQQTSIIKQSISSWPLSPNLQPHKVTNQATITYKLQLKPMTYGIQLWGSERISNINRIQRLQSQTLSVITKAPFYVYNQSLNNDLAISSVHDAM